MATKVHLPALSRIFDELGENIKLARLRRGFSSTILSERAGISRPTLLAIERGDPGVSLGNYANVLFALGLHTDLTALGRNDPLGRKLQDAQISVKQRAPKRTKGKYK